MNIENIISEIVNLPNKYNKLGNISIYFLLKETGYFENYIEINEVMILKYLVSHKDCVSQWLCWSEDKRSSSGWYFKEKEYEKYIVGYFPFKKDFITLEYSDIFEACSFFIKREIEEIRIN